MGHGGDAAAGQKVPAAAGAARKVIGAGIDVRANRVTVGVVASRRAAVRLPDNTRKSAWGATIYTNTR